MSKRLGIFLGIGLFSLLAHAQWNQKDSLRLRRILNTDGEIKLNSDVMKEIDFGTFIGGQVTAGEKPALNFDSTLPKIFPEKKALKLTLRPYTVNTRYDYDPIYLRKIKITKDTWIYGDAFHIQMKTIYSNWAKSPFDPGIRKSVEEIEATGLRYNPVAKPNSRTTGAWESAGGSGIGGLDLMTPFTKDFWDKRGRKNRERTLEALRNYGDSTTILINEEIKNNKLKN